MDMKIKRGQILKELRLEKKLSQQNIANILEVSARAYQKYEYGTAEPTFDTLSRLADFYGVSADYLLGRTTIKQMTTEQPDPFANIDVSELEKRIIKKYTELDQDARKLTIELFRQFSTIFNTEQEEQKLPESPTAQPIQQTATQKQKEDNEYITYTTTIGAEMDRRKALEAVQRAGELDDAETKKNVS
ncbi:MAG: helix-turn-helix domain-containing protein [Oscillospiraceae bacterium]|nr:helix-turn-helix domain-containing protein [Oscillospiraceae bacterium]